MYVDRMSVPGRGVLHSFRTRSGRRFCVLIDTADNRHLFTYDARDRDVATREIVLEPDEADQVADILHWAHASAGDRPIADRLLSLQRRVDELIGERAP